MPATPRVPVFGRRRVAGLAGGALVADASGVLLWDDRALVVVADLHLEKGSWFAHRGHMLPPYDTPVTLARLERVLARLAPRRVISLGDGFHDPDAAARLTVDDRARLQRLIAAHDWIWVTGNHDPRAPEGLSGRVEAAVEIDGVVFRHEPEANPRQQEVAGHLHPSASVTARGRRISRRCFVADERRMILPTFGAYTGGLDVLDPAIAGLFEDGFEAMLLGNGRVHVLPHHHLVGRRAERK